MNPQGLEELEAKKIVWQLLRSVSFIHDHNIIHRDIKPENLLLSKNGILKMCDFGFARPLADNKQDYTDYVSTRWYRAPELLIGDQNYGKAVDVWAIGCLYAEILTGEPLFPGDSDIQTLYLILQIFGDQLNEKHKTMIMKNPAFKHIKINKIEDDLDRKFKYINKDALDLLKKCLVMDPTERQDCKSLLTHRYFDDFTDLFEVEIQGLLELDANEFKKNRLRMASKERTDENNILTPRSPVFERKPVQQTFKKKDKSEIKINNEHWDRNDGTPSFNKVISKKNNKLSKNANKALEQMNLKFPEEDEFNISFTNENYNPMCSQSNRNCENENIHANVDHPNEDEIVINTRRQPNIQAQFMKENKLVHLSETYSNDNTNFRVAVAGEKGGYFKTSQDPSRKIIRQQYGSPVPSKSVKNRNAPGMSNQGQSQVFGAKQDSNKMSFPELPLETNTFPADKNIDPELEDELKPKKKRTQRVLAPNVKILDLQHNMLQFNNFPQMLFEENGRIIDSTSLREELRALKGTSDPGKKQGKLVKPKNPLDMISVEYKFSGFSIPNFNS